MTQGIAYTFPGIVFPANSLTPFIDYDAGLGMELDFVAQTARKRVGSVVVSSTFPALLNFSRASAATYWDSTGILRTAPAGSMRFSFDPVALTARGLALETTGSKNYAPYAQDPSNAVYVKTAVTLASDDTRKIDGSTSAFKMVEDTTSAEHSLANSNIAISGVSGNRVTYSAVLEYAGRQFVRLEIGGFDASSNYSGIRAIFDVQNGLLTGFSGGAALGTGTVPTAYSAKVTPYGNGRYRLVVSAQPAGIGAITKANATINLLPTAGSASVYTGDGASGVYVYFQQVEMNARNIETSLIPNATNAAVSRAAEAITISDLSWLTQGVGTLYAEASSGVQTPSPIIELSDGTANNRVMLTAATSAAGPKFDVVSAGTDVPLTGTLGTVDAVYKLGAAYAANDLAMSVNGATPLTASAAAIPTGLTVGMIGNQQGSTFGFHGHMQRIRAYSTRLPNSQLASMSA